MATANSQRRRSSGPAGAACSATTPPHTAVAAPRRSATGSQRRASWIRRCRARGSWATVSALAASAPGGSSHKPCSVVRTTVPGVHRRRSVATSVSSSAKRGDVLGRMSPIQYVLQARALTPDGYSTPSGRQSPENGAGRYLHPPVVPSPPESDVAVEASGDGRMPGVGEHLWDRVLQDARAKALESLRTGDTVTRDLYPNCHVHIWLRSCKEEVCEPLRGIVSGSIPGWIKGTLLRNGPGCLEVGKDSFQHLFDGAALLQRFCIVGGEVSYQCRFLRSRTWRRNTEAQRIVVTEFGTRAAPDPCQTIFKRVAAMFRPGEVMSDNAMISVYPIGDSFYTFTESPVVTRVDPITLQTLERVNLASSLGIVNHTSHPLVQEDGSVVNLGMSLSPTGPQYSLVHFPAPQPGDMPTSSLAAGRLRGGVAARWPLHPGYMHSFGGTGAHFVLVEQPLSVSVPSMVRGQLSGEPVAASLRWFPEHPTLIHLVSRSTGKRTHLFEADSFFFLHVINCFERPSLAGEDDATLSGEVVMDICCYKDPAMISCMYIDALKEAQRNPDYARLFRGRPWRFVLPLAPTTPRSGVRVQPRPLCDMGCETPRLNPHYVGRLYRYFYAISSDVDADNPGTLIKVDTWTGVCTTWGEPGLYPSEPIFVPRPDRQGEDDGVLLCALVWATDDRRAGLLVVDAVTMLELARAEFPTPSQVPKCLHGWFAASVV